MTRDQALFVLIGHGIPEAQAEQLADLADRDGFTEFTQAGSWDYRYCLAKLPDSTGCRAGYHTGQYQVSIR